MRFQAAAWVSWQGSVLEPAYLACCAASYHCSQGCRTRCQCRCSHPQYICVRLNYHPRWELIRLGTAVVALTPSLTTLTTMVIPCQSGFCLISWVACGCSSDTVTDITMVACRAGGLPACQAIRTRVTLSTCPLACMTRRLAGMAVFVQALPVCCCDASMRAPRVSCSSDPAWVPCHWVSQQLPPLHQPPRDAHCACRASFASTISTSHTS